MMQGMIHTPLQVYIQQFRSLNCYRNKHVRQGTAAPHKAVMLLAVMELVAEGKVIHDGRVTLSDFVVNRFKVVWRNYTGGLPFTMSCFCNPFYHLNHEPFWQLKASDTFEEHKEYSSLTALRKSFAYAQLDFDLWEYMKDSEARRLLRMSLLEFLNPDGGVNAFMPAVAEEMSCYGREKDDRGLHFRNGFLRWVG